MRIIRVLFAMLGMSLFAFANFAQTQTTAFVYQGELDDGAAPADGNYDLRFSLYSADTGGSQIGPTLCALGTPVSGGLFQVSLDFGAQYTGQQRFLEIWVRPSTGQSCSTLAGYTVLGPRQALASTPYASYALNAGSAQIATNATQLNGQAASFYTNAGNLTGTLAPSTLSGTFGGQLKFTNANNTFAGSGAGLTALNASNVSTGTLADGRLSSNVPLLNISNQFTTDQSVTGTMQAARLSTYNPLTAIVDLNSDPGSHASHAQLSAVPGYSSFGFGADPSITLGFPENGLRESILLSYFGMVAFPTGSVGIGNGFNVTSFSMYPHAGLHIAQADSTQQSYNAGLILENTATGGAPWYITSGATGTLAGGDSLNIGDGPGSSKLLLKGNGFMGLGTTTPASTLHVRNSDSSSRLVGLTIENTASFGGLWTMDVHAASTNPGYLELFPASAATQFLLSSDGKLAVGPSVDTISLGARLTLKDGALQLYSATDSKRWEVSYDASAKYFYIDELGQGRRLFIANGGKVGVGITTPEQQLSVAGGLVLDTGNTNNGTFAFGNNNGTSGSALLKFGTVSGEGIGSQRTANNGAAQNQYGLDLYTGFAPRLSITGGGNVGIGINNPTSKLQVVGNFTATTKNFTIDHPADPANKILVHSTVESDEYKNFYDGEVVTDADGYATISLPTWFELLNERFRYQLTVVDDSDAFVLAKVTRGIDHCSFTVRTSAPRTKVCWAVTGVRKDAYVKAHPLVIEQDKVGAMKGVYLNPAEHGVSEDTR